MPFTLLMPLRCRHVDVAPMLRASLLTRYAHIRRAMPRARFSAEEEQLMSTIDATPLSPPYAVAAARLRQAMMRALLLLMSHFAAHMLVTYAMLTPDCRCCYCRAAADGVVAILMLMLSSLIASLMMLPVTSLRRR